MASLKNDYEPRVAPYVSGALVSGAPAHVLDRVLRSPDVQRLVDNLPAWLRAEVEATARAIRRAAVEYEALPVSLQRSDETSFGEIAGRSTRMGESVGWVCVEQAANLLGVTPRRVQQLAAGGMGRRVGRVWQLDETAVREYGRRKVG